MKQSRLALLDELTPLLQTDRFGRKARGARVTESTNADAAAWARDGAPEGGLVLAEQQTAGRGRLGRTWLAEPGQNLTFSLVLRPRLAADRLGLLTLAAGLAVAEALEAIAAPRPVAIKWPNDVLIDGRKGCGILTESVFDGSPRPSYAVVGIGLNVNQTAFPPELKNQATSLALAVGRPVPRAPLLADLLLRLEVHYAALHATGTAASLRDAYERRLHGLGERLSLQTTASGDRIEGVLDGVTPAGALRLRTASGLRTFHAGDVTTQTVP